MTAESLALVRYERDAKGATVAVVRNRAGKEWSFSRDLLKWRLAGLERVDAPRQVTETILAGWPEDPT